MGFCTLLGAPKFICWNGDSRPCYVSFMPLRFGSNGSTVGFSTKVARPTLQADDVKTRIERRLGIGCLQSRRYLKVHEVVGRDAKKQTYILLDAQGLQDLEA